ncbi:MAG: tryptophan--tRNA ligase [Casimicrobiaceae bacterium]|nr:tryptophan--tRNA ligase [Casimicrobiaceae bacterium]
MALSQKARALSGMRPTGRMHLGHYHGALKNWVALQATHECFYFVADWHALTSHYEDPSVIAQSTLDMVADWLASGIDPERSILFVQSRVPEHAELTVLLGMITPLAWLERVPTYKEQLENLTDRDLATYGFLGYPVMQAADILIYRPEYVPVGEDQAAHVEMTREIARRFNHIYGRMSDFEGRVEAALGRLEADVAALCRRARSAWSERGEFEALAKARRALATTHALSAEEREILEGWLTGDRRAILPEPSVLLTQAARLVGLDGRKMSKSYGNTIDLREPPASVEKKVRAMKTDPKRARRSDPGNPEDCPVWTLHQVYSDEARRQWVRAGCTSASIGCLECKQPVIDAINRELAPMQERIARFEARPDYVREVLEHGCQRAQKVARETLERVREAMGLKPLKPLVATEASPAALA